MAQHELFNRKNKKQLIQELDAEPFERKTCSFYRYVKIPHPPELRDKLYGEWKKLGVLGRIYLADEGINIQLISTSEIKISVGIADRYLELAVRSLHRVFGLDESPEHEILGPAVD